MLCASGPRFWKQLSLLFSTIVVALILTANVTAQQARTAVIRVTATDEAEKPVPGVLVELKLKGSVVASAVTTEKGEAEFKSLVPDTYEIVVSKESLETLTQTDVQVSANTPTEVKITMVPRVELKDTVTIKAGAEAPPIEKGASPGNVLQPADVKNTPIQPATVKDTLPLVPGVVRSSEGEIKISGTGEHRSALVVNSADVTDPATGQFGVTVPVDSVQTIEVFKTPYLAQFGRFTAGVVSVETRRGGDKWNFELNDPLPEFRIRSGHLQGLREASPRVTFNGPLIENKFYFSEGLEYDLQKRPDRTLPFGSNESKQESINSFTQLDYILSPLNTLTGTFHLAPRQMEFVNLNFFNPQPVTPTFRAHDYTGTIIDRWTIGNNLLESTLSVKRFTGNVWGQGAENMVLTPVGNLGNYFSEQNREASRAEWIEMYSLSPVPYYGAHNLKFGSTIARTGNRGDFVARPVEIKDTAGQLLKRIDWVGGNQFNLFDLEGALFGQDHWVINPSLSLDIGLRAERQGITETVRVAPRIGLAWAPFAHAQTTVRGGFGLFYDRVPLSVYAFNGYPEQVITTYGANGEIIDGPRHFINITDRAESSRLPFLFSHNVVGNFAPYSETWNVEVEHPINKMLRVRANYLQSNSFGVIIFTPKVVENRDALVLGGGGRSGYHQFELTARLSLMDNQQVFLSYVHSRTKGDLNEFNNYLGNFPFPVVRPNSFTNLSGDLPNRFLAWGMVRLPWKMRVSPLVEWRTGFPYPITNAQQDFVGTPNLTRFPNFFSLDSRVSKDFKMSDKYTLRFSVSAFNVSNHFNPLQVHANIDDPQMGVFFNTHRRRFRLDFDVIF